MNRNDKSPRTVSELMDHLHQQELEWERLHDVGAPQIGIFYVIDRRVYLDAEFKDLVTPGLDGIRQERNFETLWRNLLRYKVVQGGLYHHPRGRIIFNDSLSRFFLYVDTCLLESKNRNALNQILIEFNLDPSQVSTLPSLDYKCARCHCNWGFQEVEVEIVKRPDAEASAT